MRFSSLSIICVSGLCLALAGCGQPPEPTFAVSSKVTPLVAPAQEMVSKSLVEHFGTPNNLVAWKQLPVDFGIAQPNASNTDRQEAGWRLKEGRNLYMVHCLHCHGVAGDGNGTTARFLNPRPRDYRQGKFKFKSTAGGVKPTSDDLLRVLEEGVPGTYMPSFVLLGREQLGILVDYVRWLSIRGEMEEKLGTSLTMAGLKGTDLERALKEKQEEDKSLTRDKFQADLLAEANAEWSATVTESAQDVIDSWNSANEAENVIVPASPRVPSDAASIARGKALFLSKENKCSDCHGLAGRGDGPQTEQFPKIPGAIPERSYDTPGLRDDWGEIIVPRNLTRGVYRFGRRPLDIYRKVHTGINGTPMPGFGKSLKSEQIWDVVNFVMSLQYEGQAASPADIAQNETDEGHGTPGHTHSGRSQVADANDR